MNITSLSILKVTKHSVYGLFMFVGLFCMPQVVAAQESMWSWAPSEVTSKVPSPQWLWSSPVQIVRQMSGGADYLFRTAGEILTVGNVGNKQYRVASSEDGSKLVVYSGSEGVPGYFVSVDGGKTWTDRTYAAGTHLNRGFFYGSITGLGNRLYTMQPVMGELSQKLIGYTVKTSDNDGASWGQLTFPVSGHSNSYFGSKACFGDRACLMRMMSEFELGPIYSISYTGDKLLYMATWSGDKSCDDSNCQSIWISNDGGNSWFKSKQWYGGGKGPSFFIDPAYSNDGQTIMFANEGLEYPHFITGRRLYFSRDGGLSWNEQEFDSPISGMAAVGDGATMLVTTFDKVYKSTDGGSTWPQVGKLIVPDEGWLRVGDGIRALSRNGKVMVSGSTNPYLGAKAKKAIYVSFDEGRTWSSRDLPGLPDDGFRHFWLTPDGQKIITLVGNTGKIFTASTAQNVVWTEYCTGANNPNGKDWQWWEKSDTSPIEYRFVRQGDGVCAAPALNTTGATGKIEVTKNGVCETQGVDGYTSLVCPVKVAWSSSAKNTSVKVHHFNAKRIPIKPERMLALSSESSGSLTIKIPLGQSTFELYDASVYPSPKFASVVYEGVQWTPYCTGDNDPNGNNWQWWEKSNTNPAEYRFARKGDGTCSPSVLNTTPAPIVPTTPTPSAVVVPATPQAPSGSIKATTCTPTTANSTCKVSVTWTSEHSKDGWTQINVVKPDGTTVDSYKVQRANSDHTFNLSPGLYALALIGFKQDASPVILKSTSVTVAAAPAPAPSTPTTNKIPFGYLDAATCTELKGWAYDSDNQNAAVTLHVYEGSTFVTSGKANVARADVNRTMGITGDHGFTIPLPATLKDGKAHTLAVYALDTAGGKSANLQQSPRTVTCAAAVAPQMLLAAVVTTIAMPFGFVTNVLADTFLNLGFY